MCDFKCRQYRSHFVPDMSIHHLPYEIECLTKIYVEQTKLLLLVSNKHWYNVCRRWCPSFLAYKPKKVYSMRLVLRHWLMFRLFTLVLHNMSLLRPNVIVKHQDVFCPGLPFLVVNHRLIGLESHLKNVTLILKFMKSRMFNAAGFQNFF